MITKDAKNLANAINRSIRFVRSKMLAQKNLTEEEVLVAFVEAFSAELCGWEMRLQELEKEA
ncbi:MAG: hypothetical protein ABIH23_26420 [bacterium]